MNLQVSGVALRGLNLNPGLARYLREQVARPGGH
jgi:hypothetical protein